MKALHSMLQYSWTFLNCFATNDERVFECCNLGIFTCQHGYSSSCISVEGVKYRVHTLFGTSNSMTLKKKSKIPFIPSLYSYCWYWLLSIYVAGLLSPLSFYSAFQRSIFRQSSHLSCGLIGNTEDLTLRAEPMGQE